MSRLLPISVRELVARLRKLGFEGPFPGGKHSYMRKAGIRLAVPNLHAGDLSVGLVARILREGGVSREEWESAGK